jgi:hypothetical protein
METHPGRRLAKARREALRWNAALAALPMPGPHAPTISLPNPLMRDPMPSGPRRLPMARYPHMAVPDPFPIPAQPHVTGYRRHTDHLLARTGRRDHHDTARDMPLIGDDDTAGECRSDQQQGSPTENVRTHVGDQSRAHLEYRNVPVLCGLTAMVRDWTLKSIPGAPTRRAKGGRVQSARSVAVARGWADDARVRRAF